MDVWQGLYDLKMEQDIFVGMTLSVCVVHMLNVMEGGLTGWIEPQIFTLYKS